MTPIPEDAWREYAMDLDAALCRLMAARTPEERPKLLDAIALLEDERRQVQTWIDSEAA